MTNEEINNAAEAFFERRRQSQGGRMDWLGVGLLAEHMRALVLRVYEEVGREAKLRALSCERMLDDAEWLNERTQNCVGGKMEAYEVLAGVCHASAAKLRVAPTAPTSGWGVNRMMTEDEKELIRGAKMAMQGLFIVYLHSRDDALNAKVRAMMEDFWAWKDQRDAQEAPSAPPG